ncbi:Ypt/Rab-GAP domain of gyp1p superfamily protein [Actinidia rufa]|uniref:Ypt/Rab-GAP domain of gyp1p superfamily protein n=1 Tax=Actinidia rufa TaxID=165716 RepID=A0A7J0GVT7_9ERIC|nr:Ypt/Rab-GAP domain of gyp1p superfamily protein [Actinidia rufa]
MIASAEEEADSPVQPLVPEPPPSAARPEHPKVKVRDRINESSDNGSSGSGSSSVETFLAKLSSYKRSA